MAALLCAQDFRASISGRVTDSSGALVPGAKVTAANTETGQVASAETNDAGLYNLPALPPGRYTLTAEKTGFKKYAREAFALEVQGRPQIDIVLETGDVQSTVTVSSDTPLLETASASRV
jgi:protocatechuate 3,4-dioxygenase beta subunit